MLGECLLVHLGRLYRGHVFTRGFRGPCFVQQERGSVEEDVGWGWWAFEEKGYLVRLKRRNVVCRVFGFVDLVIGSNVI